MKQVKIYSYSPSKYTAIAFLEIKIEIVTWHDKANQRYNVQRFDKLKKQHRQLLQQADYFTERLQFSQKSQIVNKLPLESDIKKIHKVGLESGFKLMPGYHERTR